MAATDLSPSGHLHFMGIGGVGMAGLAYLLKKRGFTVTGCDKYATARTQWLEEADIPVAIGHSPQHLDQATTLVITPAVPKDEPERQAAQAHGLTMRFRGEMLAELVNLYDGIAVCGTHGKTTTATFAAKLLHLLGDDPAWCIGGETGTMPVAHLPERTDRTPKETPLVVEADESDGTLALYRARTLVITSMDYDHPEHFKTRADYVNCFAQAEQQANDIIRSWELDASDWPELSNLVLGAHNIANARAAIEVALRRGHTRHAIAAVLPEALSALPDRRFQVLWPPQTSAASTTQATIVTDYAHHPAELSCALNMAKALKPKRLRVLFQPHRYSRTKALKDQFPDAFVLADEVVLIPVYPAFESPILGGDIADLYHAFRQRQQEDTQLWSQGLRLARSPIEAWRHVYLTYEEGDLILLAGAGDIINLTPQILRDMAKGPATRNAISLAQYSFFKTGGLAYGGGKPYVIGMGSNTWFSDCASDLTLTHAPSKLETSSTPSTVPAGLVGARLLDKGSPFRNALSFMAGIPGTVGGWTKMNAGAFGHEIGEVIESVSIEDETGVVRTLLATACGFAYRHSTIPGRILAVTFKSTPSPNDLPAPEDYLARRKHFPPRTCGSVFKNPSPGNSAGGLLEEAGAKALRVGGAYVWQEHANVIVADKGCTSSDILALSRLMAARVRHKFGITLEPEIRGLK